MNLNIEEVIKIPKFGNRQNFEEIVKILGIEFDYDKTLFEKDMKYSTQTTHKLINQVTNSNDDVTKMALLYSLRDFFEYYNDLNSSIGQELLKLVGSFQDKVLISQLTEYLDDENQIENMSNMIEHFSAYFTHYQLLSQKEIDEINENVIPEIQNKKQIFLTKKEREKQDFLSKKKQEEQDKKDNKIIRNLDNLQNNSYEKIPSWEVAYQIRELSSDNLKISAMEMYFTEVCNKLRENNTHIPTFKLMMLNELEGITEVIASMHRDENKKLLMEKYLDRTFSFYKDLYASLGEEMDGFYHSEYDNYKFRCILSLDDRNEELEQLQKEGKLEDYLKYERNSYGKVNPNTIAKDVLNLDSDKEKFEELKSGDIRKVIIAHSSYGILGVNNRIIFTMLYNFIDEFR